LDSVLSNSKSHRKTPKIDQTSCYSIQIYSPIEICQKYPEGKCNVSSLNLVNGLKDYHDAEDKKQVTSLKTLMSVMVRKIRHRKMKSHNLIVFHANMKGKKEAVL
jgi:hypothetical protein